MKICRFNQNRLGVVLDQTVADVSEALPLFTRYRDAALADADPPTQLGLGQTSGGTHGPKDGLQLGRSWNRSLHDAQAEHGEALKAS